ncbi:helix-turn-helix domain-containing protein [Dietzia alimentaria]|uniref:helix-turn-helix domain-containing protein n=1 Tax=Dietzia alimentaria TaxID=665550 RepID=UPI00029AA870|nr:helix-turn-helix domain-containing protein [Dietzia alimentaria]
MRQIVRTTTTAPDSGQLGQAWRRSTLCGLTPQNARPGAPDPHATRSRRLAEAARPVMDGVDAVLRDTGAMLLLADREGRVIRTVRDDARISRMLLRRGVDDGVTLTEDAVGNNGIGTALETRAGVFIRGEEHFAEMLRDFSCYGHPIVDPLTRRLVGALDLTGMNADASRLFAPFVRKIVADIEARYVDTARADDRELWHRFLERTRGSDVATCAFGDEVVLASHASLERLASHDIATLRRLVERDQLPDAVELSVGTVGVLSSRVGRRGHLLDLSFPDLEPPADAPRRRRSNASRKPPATAARRDTVRVTSGAHAVVGPSGSGRTTTARAIAGPDAEHVRLAEADSATQAWREMVVPALRSRRDRGGPDELAGPAGGEGRQSLVLDDIDLLADADLRRLASRLDAADCGVVVVTSRDDPRPAVTEALDACSARTTVRPLHERGTESGEIVREMVAHLASARGMAEPTLTARFVDAACALDLPNGLVSLRSILAECLGQPGKSGAPAPAQLDLDALPTRARSSRPPRSGELARGEYDAIVAALASCDGVRSRAARRLGISRTTLYARMREFGLS